MALLQDRVALVTGGSSGIGRATALAFAAEGAKVAVADVDEAGGAETVRLIEAAGGKALFVQTDVSRADDVQAMVDRAVETFGRLDCAYNNAGITGPRAPTVDCTEADWDEVQATNLKGVWLCMRAELAYMTTQGHGAIVNIGSIAALVGSRNASIYAACSHGVLGMTKSAALEYAQAGIRVNAVCPGAIRTPLMAAMIAGRPEVEAKYAGAQPVGRMGDVGEVAQTVVWLCSDAASFVTGVAVPVDGGRAAG